MILGSRGTPNGHTEVQMSVFVDFRTHLGTLLGHTLDTCLRFSVIWDVQMEDSFQVHAFSDPGAEMMLTPDGWMCQTRLKTRFVEGFHVVDLFTNLVS